MTRKDDQNLWNFFYTVFYVGVALAMLFILMRENGALPTTIAFFDLVLIMLATYRLIRLFVYDKVMRWLRDIFAPYEQGPLKTASDLLGCPWCFGVWAATFVTFFYFLMPEWVWFLILVAAIAGVASLVQLVANAIGWSAEKKKLETKRLER